SMASNPKHLIRIRLFAPLVLLAIAGCRDPLPCEDCGEDAVGDGDQEEGPLPDLPCGGADLMTDNDNCGTCGNACNVWYEGTDLEAGTCQAGVCGPSWVTCGNAELSAATCEERCAQQDRACVPGGCSGLTGVLFHVA